MRKVTLLLLITISSGCGKGGTSSPPAPIAAPSASATVKLCGASVQCRNDCNTYVSANCHVNGVEGNPCGQMYDQCANSPLPAKYAF